MSDLITSLLAFHRLCYKLLWPVKEKKKLLFNANQEGQNIGQRSALIYSWEITEKAMEFYNVWTESDYGDWHFLIEAYIITWCAIKSEQYVKVVSVRPQQPLGVFNEATMLI